ncbi:hypothetical protein ACE1BS_18320 [Aeromonas jandaei]
MLCKLLSFDFFYKSKIYWFFVANYRRPNLIGVEHNLINLGFGSEESSIISIKESQSHLIRDIHTYWYKTSNYQLLAKQIDQFELQDDDAQIMMSLHDNASILAILHFGHYWESVAKVVKLSSGKVKFVIPILSLAHEHIRESILSLKVFCLDLIVVDISDRRSAIKQITKCINNGYKLIIFPDLPPSIGSVFFGSPSYGFFFNKRASIASGTLELARLFKLDMTYVSSFPSELGQNQVFFIERVKHVDVSVDKNFSIIETMIRKNPQHWAYLDRVENYFQHQLSETELKQKWNI